MTISKEKDVDELSPKWVGEKVMNGRWHSKHFIVILNMLWCPLALPMHLLFFNIWWMMRFVNIWMILWSVTLMKFSFFQRAWQIMSTMYILCWRNFKKLNFMPSWKNVNSINQKWVTLSLEMAFAWTLIRSIPL